jgi:hypothetical protein
MDVAVPRVVVNYGVAFKPSTPRLRVGFAEDLRDPPELSLSQSRPIYFWKKKVVRLSVSRFSCLFNQTLVILQKLWLVLVLVVAYIHQMDFWRNPRKGGGRVLCCARCSTCTKLPNLWTQFAVALIDGCGIFAGLRRLSCVDGIYRKSSTHLELCCVILVLINSHVDSFQSKAHASPGLFGYYNVTNPSLVCV